MAYWDSYSLCRLDNVFRYWQSGKTTKHLCIISVHWVSIKHFERQLFCSLFFITAVQSVIDFCLFSPFKRTWDFFALKYFKQFFPVNLVMFKLYISVMRFILLSDPKRSRQHNNASTTHCFRCCFMFSKGRKKSTESHFTCSVFK